MTVLRLSGTGIKTARVKLLRECGVVVCIDRKVKTYWWTNKLSKNVRDQREHTVNYIISKLRSWHAEGQSSVLEKLRVSHGRILAVMYTIISIMVQHFFFFKFF